MIPPRGSPERRRLFGQGRRLFWVVFGLVGLLDLELHWGLGIASSIKVLFAISVYANFAGDSSVVQGARTEILAQDTTVEHADVVNTQ